jgi:site-specific DNA recombinase
VALNWGIGSSSLNAEVKAFEAAQEQLRENRTRSIGLAKARSSSAGSDLLCPLWIRLLRQYCSAKGKGRVLTDFRYYRCSGTDGYRFGGDGISSNTQVRADILENEIYGRAYASF